MADLRQGRPMTAAEQVYNYVLEATGSHGVADQASRLVGGVQAFNPLPQAYEAGQNVAEGVLDANPAQTAYGVGMGALATVPGMAVGRRAAQGAADVAGQALERLPHASQGLNTAVRSADEALTTTGQISPDVAAQLMRSQGQIDDITESMQRGLNVPMGRQTAAAGAIGAGTAVAGDMAFNDFSVDDYNDWLRSAGLAAAGAAGGVAGERIGARVGRPKKQYSNQTRTKKVQDPRDGLMIEQDEPVPGVTRGEVNYARDVQRNALAATQPRLQKYQNALSRLPKPGSAPRQSDPSPTTGRGTAGVDRPAKTRPRPTNQSTEFSGRSQDTRRSRPALHKSSKVQIAEAFRQSDGRLSLKEAQKIAPNANPDRVKGFLREMRSLRNGGLDNKAMIEFVKRGGSLAGAGVVGGVTYNALSRNRTTE
ncbi:hypothetical protein [Pararhizobium sp.]|uniref:hypothetical protein n=1 Tax=Pararhizobium sp. TaxID=1977563 RepID=UPI003D11B724